MVYGYVRVSTKEQNVARQIQALLSEGIEEKNIYIDRQSGKDFKRKRYQALLRKLKPGDVLMVKELDRLGRNYCEIIENWRLITMEKRVDMVVLDIPMLDTRRKGDDLTGRLIADLVLQILSYVAETERRNIRQRQAEGIAAAKARGVHFGNPGIPLPDNFNAVVGQWRRREIPLEDALRLLGVSRSYFYRQVKEHNL
ncbi:MAG: recombinase family protein [Bacteroidales bacterium]|nr:recombinase family protein [Bacteroidales bacterium]